MMSTIKLLLTALVITFVACSARTQEVTYPFNIRTITAGVTVSALSDTTSILEAITFLKQAKAEYEATGYVVQTIRISTQHLYQYLDGKTLQEALPFLQVFDKIAQKEGMPFSVGYALPPDTYQRGIGDWAYQLITSTEQINFSLPVSSKAQGILDNGIKAAAEVTLAVAKRKEGNFRFTASANCPPNIPFFPAAYHIGENSFGIGIEYPALMTEIFKEGDWNTAKKNLKEGLETHFLPIENMAMELSRTSGWKYDGIDSSPAPGLTSSIGEAIETLTKQPFGGPLTLSACAMITDVIKSLDLQLCGYSGLMLPVIEDKVLALRAGENRFTVQELLLFSSVSGTGLDVIPLPGNTSQETVARIYRDVASLSLKYTDKALSARLFLIPGKEAGDMVEFDNPYLTTAKVMKIE